jgi:single-strand DNA-binding protein
MSLNKILLLGNLGSDPEVRFMPSGKQTTQFSLATNRKYKMEGQIREETEWFQIVAFGRLAEICSEFLKKGRQVFIEGRMRTRSWTDNAGQKHYRTEVIAEGMRLIGKTNGSTSNAAQSPDQESDPDHDPF